MDYYESQRIRHVRECVFFFKVFGLIVLATLVVMGIMAMII